MDIGVTVRVLIMFLLLLRLLRLWYVFKLNLK